MDQVSKEEVRELRREFDLLDHSGWGILTLEMLTQAIAKIKLGSRRQLTLLLFDKADVKRHKFVTFLELLCAKYPKLEQTDLRRFSLSYLTGDQARKYREEFYNVTHGSDRMYRQDLCNVFEMFCGMRFTIKEFDQSPYADQGLSFLKFLETFFPCIPFTVLRKHVTTDIAKKDFQMLEDDWCAHVDPDCSGVAYLPEMYAKLYRAPKKPPSAEGEENAPPPRGEASGKADELKGRKKRVQIATPSESDGKKESGNAADVSSKELVLGEVNIHFSLLRQGDEEHNGCVSFRNFLRTLYPLLAPTRIDQYIQMYARNLSPQPAFRPGGRAGSETATVAWADEKKPKKSILHQNRRRSTAESGLISSYVKTKGLRSASPSALSRSAQSPMMDGMREFMEAVNQYSHVMNQANSYMDMAQGRLPMSPSSSSRLDIYQYSSALQKNLLAAASGAPNPKCLGNVMSLLSSQGCFGGIGGGGGGGDPGGGFGYPYAFDFEAWRSQSIWDEIRRGKERQLATTMGVLFQLHTAAAIRIQKTVRGWLAQRILAVRRKAAEEARRQAELEEQYRLEELRRLEAEQKRKLKRRVKGSFSPKRAKAMLAASLAPLVQTVSLQDLRRSAYTIAPELFQVVPPKPKRKKAKKPVLDEFGNVKMRRSKRSAESMSMYASASGMLSLAPQQQLMSKSVQLPGTASGSPATTLRKRGAGKKHAHSSEPIYNIVINDRPMVMASPSVSCGLEMGASPAGVAFSPGLAGLAAGGAAQTIVMPSGAAATLSRTRRLTHAALSQKMQQEAAKASSSSSSGASPMAYSTIMIPSSASTTVSLSPKVERKVILDEARSGSPSKTVVFTQPTNLMETASPGKLGKSRKSRGSFSSTDGTVTLGSDASSISPGGRKRATLQVSVETESEFTEEGSPASGAGRRGGKGKHRSRSVSPSAPAGGGSGSSMDLSGQGGLAGLAPPSTYLSIPTMKQASIPRRRHVSLAGEDNTIADFQPPPSPSSGKKQVCIVQTPSTPVGRQLRSPARAMFSPASVENSPPAGTIKIVGGSATVRDMSPKRPQPQSSSPNVSDVELERGKSRVALRPAALATANRGDASASTSLSSCSGGFNSLRGGLMTLGMPAGGAGVAATAALGLDGLAALAAASRKGKSKRETLVRKQLKKEISNKGSDE